jgi:hypothetical protein
MFLQLLYTYIIHCTRYGVKFFKKCNIFECCKNIENVKGLTLVRFRGFTKFSNIAYIERITGANSVGDDRIFRNRMTENEVVVYRRIRRLERTRVDAHKYTNTTCRYCIIG